MGNAMLTAEDKLRCAEREYRMRQRVYPNRIETGRMSAAKTKYELAVMAAIIEDYREQAERERLC